MVMRVIIYFSEVLKCLNMTSIKSSRSLCEIAVS